MLNYNKTLKRNSRQLRKNMTDAEKALWFKIKGKQLKEYQFFRQKPIGNFIVDFFCPKARMVIELDGGQHYSIDGKAKDVQRDAYLKNIGLTVLRFSDRDVLKNLESVVETIWSNLQNLP